MAVTLLSGREQRIAVAADASPAVAIWLWSVAALIFAMIVVGGATRLTESGLSITEWQPLLGAIPPLNDADWLAAFEKYKQIPQYHLVNHGMSLEEFKTIYWWEWSHRFLGRFIGAAFAIPLVAFWFAGRLKRRTAAKLLVVLALGGLQGVIGWYMVKSGLADRVDVSQYRLALHLTTAFAILGLVVWLASDEWPAAAEFTARGASPAVGKVAAALVALVLAQVVLGAFVAGLKAGLIYNTWPKMGDQWIPGDYWTSAGLLSFFESHAAAQFNHRLTAYLVVLLALTQVHFVLHEPSTRRVRATAVALGIAVLVQMTIGIATLLAHVPLGLGLLHQAGGAIVLVIAVLHLHAVRAAIPASA